MRTSNAVNINEIEYLEKRFNIYYSYFLQYYHPQKHKSDLWVLTETKKMVEEIVRKKNLTKFKRLTKELDSDLRDLPMKVANQIRNLYHTQLGEDIEAEEKKYLEKIEKIRKRGKIKTEAEYRLIETRLDELFLENPEGEAWQEMDKLLGTFEI